MNGESWRYNLGLALLEMKTWQNNFVEKERQKNKEITYEELSKKIRNAQTRKFGNQFDYLVTEHPNCSME